MGILERLVPESLGRLFQRMAPELPAPRFDPWAAQLHADAAAVLTAVREDGADDLHRSLQLYVRALALEAGAAYDAGRPLPGLAEDEGLRTVDVPGTTVFLRYAVYPARREIQVTGIVWV